MTKSPDINRATEIASSAGNEIREISEDWTTVDQVVHMAAGLTDTVRAEIQRQVPTLRYWKAERTPHNSSEEGFICDLHKVGVTFPRG